MNTLEGCATYVSSSRFVNQISRFLLFFIDLTRLDRSVFLVFIRHYGTEPSMTSLLEHLRVQLRRLLPVNSTLILACSGGPDSQAMLDLVGQLKSKGLVTEIVAVGVDHGLRSEARNELALVSALAQSYGIPFHALKVSLRESGNLLENARDARYGAIRRFAESYPIARIATAHSATDQCETLVQRLSRGTSLRGAGAIRETRADLIRPLLNVTRSELVAYVDSRQVAYASDPSNLDRTRTRTRIREDLVPVLNALNPEAEKHWSRFAGRSALATDYLDRMAEPILKQATGHLSSLDISTLKMVDPYLRQWALSLWLQSQNLPIESSFLDAIVNLLDTPGKKMTLGGRMIRNEAGRLWAPPCAPNESQKMTVGEPVRVQPLDGYLKSHLNQQKKTQFSQLKSPTQVAFDADRLHLGLEVRPWRAGDRLTPFGLQGSVKIGDLFTNLKIPTPLRQHWPVVVCGEEIIWVVGLRRGAIAPMSNTTTNVLYMEYVGTLIT